LYHLLCKKRPYIGRFFVHLSKLLCGPLTGTGPPKLEMLPGQTHICSRCAARRSAASMSTQRGKFLPVSLMRITYRGAIDVGGRPFRPCKPPDFFRTVISYHRLKNNLYQVKRILIWHKFPFLNKDKKSFIE